MIYGSVCSGVEAATVAWHPLGWNPAWFCEFDKFPSAVLDIHYPDVPNLHDMTTIEEKDIYHERSIDLLVGGTPCQSFSIAGLRKGLDDDRGNLALKFCQILRDKQPRWFVWENVPGVLSSNEGRDFAAILSGFRECGYEFAYRVLGAQYFGNASQRRRVFVVGYTGDWRPPAAVLFEQKSFEVFTKKGTSKVAPTLTAKSGRRYNDGEVLVKEKENFRWNTPLEDERIMGFPDNYTNIPWRGKNQSPDGPRHKAMGNSMAVPVMRWIGERIDMFEKLQ